MYSFVHVNKTKPTRKNIGLEKQQKTLLIMRFMLTNITALVDHIIHNCPGNVKKHEVLHNGMSDHSISYLIWYSETSSSPRLISFRSCKTLDAEK